MARLSDLMLPAMPIGYDVALGFVLGLIFGSYLGTILWRWPRGLRANEGRSHCDHCDRQLIWYELIPLAGPLFSGGRCRECGEAIGWQHSAIELTCGMLGAYCFAMAMPWAAPLGWLLILLAWFDIRHLWLPNRLVALLAIIALVTPAGGDPSLMERIAGGAIGFGVLWTVATAYRHFRERDGLGGGDAKLFGAIGLWIGALDLPLVLLIACTLGLIDAVIRIARGQEAASIKLPLGTYLCVAAIGMIFLLPIIHGKSPL